MNENVKVCIISESNLERDPRVLRQLQVLSKENYVIHTIALSPSWLETEFHSIKVAPNNLFVKLFKALLSFFHLYFLTERILVMRNRKIIHDLSGVVFDIIIANDIEAMMLATRLNSQKILLDCHEYSAEQHKKTLKNQLLRIGIAAYLTRKYINQADQCTTVCKSISDKYLANFGRAPKIIFNVPDYCDLCPSPVDPDKIRMIHHGGAIRTRQLERMIFAIDHLDEKFELDLMLVPTNMDYYRELQIEVSKRRKVRLIQPVPYNEIVKKINKYDVGIYNLEPTNLNDEFSLPNKFFEYIQARLAVAIGPSIEMHRIVKENNIGVTSEDFSTESFAECISTLTVEKIEIFKKESDLIAKRFSNDTVSHELEIMIKEIMQN